MIPGSQSLVCLSSDAKYIHVLDKGVVPRYKFVTDPIFKGISKLWAIKCHYQETIHDFVFMSSENSTLAFKMGEYLLTDVTNVLNLDKKISTKSVYNLKNSGFLVLVTPRKITIADLSKVDSADNEFTKFEYENSKENWDLVCHHDLFLFCFSQRSNLLSVFSIKNRPRDLNLVVLIQEIDISTFGVVDTEISCILAQSSDSGINIYMSSITGHIYRISLDFSCNLIRRDVIYVSEIIEDMLFTKSEFSSEIYAGTRLGVLLLVNFDSSIVTRIEKLSSSPIKLSQLCNNTLLAYGHDSSTLIGENYKECIRRKVANWHCDCAIEFVYRFAESYVVGIKEDSFFIMSIPSLSENILSKRTLFHNAKISAFLVLSSCKWIIGYTNSQEKKNYATLFDSNGSEISSLDQGSDEIIRILSVNDSSEIVLIASVTKDQLQSKFNLVNIEASKFEAKNEYICSGSITNVKISGR